MATVSTKKARQRIATVWFTGALILFLLLLLQSIFGHYGERTEDAWAWLLPTIMPSVSLILGVLVSDHLRKKESRGQVDRFLFLTVLLLSVFYLLVVISTIALSPVAALKPLELMSLSSLWLGPLQGLACAGLSAFFVATPRKPDAEAKSSS